MTSLTSRKSGDLPRLLSRRIEGASRRAIIALLAGALTTIGAVACGGNDPDDPGGNAGTSGRGGSGGNGGAIDAGSTGGNGGSGTGGGAGSGGAGGGTGGFAGKGGSGGTGGAAGTGGATAGAGGTGGRVDAGGSGGSAGATDGGKAGSDAGGSAGRDGASDAPVVVDAPFDGAIADTRTTDMGNCTVPDPKDTTITAYQSDIVSRLAGQTEIAPGVKLANRATATNRQAARDYMKTLFQDLGLTPADHAYGSGTNVYATLPATTGGTQTVVLGAHFDSVMVSPGANDNATGVAAVFAVARYATKLSCRSKAITFVLFDEEEVGLVGSKQFATKLKNDGTSVHSVHTIDQMGWDSDGDRAIELELPDTGLRELYQTAVTKLGVTVALTATTTASTDHSSFRPTFLAVGLTEEYATKPSDTTPYYHKAGDTFDTVNFEYLLSTTVIVNQVFADLTR